MEKRADKPVQGTVSAGGQPEPLGFRETVLRDIRRFSPQINKALESYAQSGDGHSVWGMLFYLQGSDVSADHHSYVELGNKALAGFEGDGMGAELADMHTRMRSFGIQTQITEKSEESMQKLLSSGRGYGDGWTIAHMLHNMNGFPDLREKPQILNDNGYNDTGFMFQALTNAQGDKDGGSLGWMHLRMRELGEQTDITLRDKAVFWREYKRTVDALEAGDSNPDTAKTLAGLNYLYRRYIRESQNSASVK